MMSAMDENAFWQLIEDCRPSGPDPDPDADGLVEALTEALAAGPESRITGFAEQLAWALYRLDRKESAGTSGDGFLYTRCAVVAEGRAVYERVLADPALFVPYLDGLVWAEGLLSVAENAYEELTGDEWDHETRYDYETGSNREGWADA